MEDDPTYYARRADAESRTAATAPDGRARRLHFQLAEMLRAKAALARPRPDPGAARGLWPPR